MTDLSHLHATRESYDTVAESYAEFVRPAFARGAVGRAMLGAFAETVLGDGGRGRVADLGCGPGHVTAYLDSLGLSVFGIDLSPAMVTIARRSHPTLHFDVGPMQALDLHDGELDGVVAWWSIIHTPSAQLPMLFAEFRRVLAPGGHLLLGFHAGDERRTPKKAYGHAISYDAYRNPPDRVADQLETAGFTVTARLISEGAKTPQACVFARALSSPPPPP